jgi:hypothetical protein
MRLVDKRAAAAAVAILTVETPSVVEMVDQSNLTMISPESEVTGETPAIRLGVAV